MLSEIDSKLRQQPLPDDPDGLPLSSPRPRLQDHLLESQHAVFKAPQNCTSRLPVPVPVRASESHRTGPTQCSSTPSEPQLSDREIGQKLNELHRKLDALNEFQKRINDRQEYWLSVFAQQLEDPDYVWPAADPAGDEVWPEFAWLWSNVQGERSSSGEPDTVSSPSAEDPLSK